MASAPFVASTNDISSDDETEDEYSWISYFCSLKGNELFCEIDPDFVSDSFNLTGLAAEVPYYEFALDVILDVEVNDDQISEEQQELIETEAETLYGLIHARFILCKKGLHAMYEKYRLGEFGHCPRVYCKNQSMLPVGIYDRPGKDSVKTFCPRCQDVYQPKFPRSDKIDGAFFGSTFPHLFFLEFPELAPTRSTETYDPAVFGFKLHPTSHSKALATKREISRR